MVLRRQYKPLQVFAVNPYARNLEGLEAFKRLPEFRRKQIRLIRNHFSFGMHEGVNRPFTYFTLLREPVDRVVSHYYFIKRAPADLLHRDVISQRMSLEDLMASGLWLDADNGQVRQLSGVKNAFQIPFGESSEDMLERAKRNLQQYFAVVGLSEYFDETLLMLKRAFQWKSIYYVSQNVGEDRPPLDEVSLATREIIQRYNSLDIKLHQFAKDLLTEQIANYGHRFDDDLRRFQKRNAVYGTLYRGLSRILRETHIRAFARRFI
jgi:hypothetical protein